MLQGAIIALKNTRFVPSSASNNENKEKRKIYVQKHLNETSVETQILYIDETNFNLFIPQSQGRAEKETQVNLKRLNSKWKKINLIIVIGTNGFSLFRVRRGSFTP